MPDRPADVYVDGGRHACRWLMLERVGGPFTWLCVPKPRYAHATCPGLAAGIPSRSVVAHRCPESHRQRPRSAFLATA